MCTCEQMWLLVLICMILDSSCVSTSQPPSIVLTMATTLHNPISQTQIFAPLSLLEHELAVKILPNYIWQLAPFFVECKLRECCGKRWGHHAMSSYMGTERFSAWWKMHIILIWKHPLRCQGEFGKHLQYSINTQSKSKFRPDFGNKNTPGTEHFLFISQREGDICLVYGILPLDKKNSNTPVMGFGDA